MKKAKYINSNSIEIIDIDKYLTNINIDYDNFIKEQGITDADLLELENNKSTDFEKKREFRKKVEEDRKSEINKLSSQYLTFVPCQKSELKKFSIRHLSYTTDGECVYEHETIEENNHDLINARIKELNKYLSDTDYIIIKSYEAKLSMSDIPYTQEYLDNVCNERQKARDEINELELLLK